MTITYRPRRKPYAHQVAALKKLCSTGFGGALLMDPRTGKTQVCLDYASVMHQASKVSRVLIVCPLSAMGVWEDEIAECVADRYTITVWDRKTRRSQELPRFGRDCLDFVIVNYDAFSTAGAVRGYQVIPMPDGTTVKVPVRSTSRGGRYDVKKKLLAWQPHLIILDESHRIKTPSAKKTTMCYSLGAKSPYRIIATGTAVTKKKRVFDIYSQWNFLNPSGWVSNFTAKSFKEHFGVWVSLKNYDRFVRNKNMDKLHKMIHTDAFAVTRDECFDLPPQRTQIRHIDLDPEEARMYDEMAEDLIARIKTGEITEAQIKLVQVLRFAQITSGIAKLTPTEQHPKGRLVRIGRSKLRYLEDRLLDLSENDEKVVVVARFRADLSGIVAVCKKLKIPYYEMHGGIKKPQRDANVKAFRAHEGTAVFVMQPQVGALAIDLRTAATMIWFSLTNSYVDWDQCNQRIALNSRGTVIEYMLARGTNDEVMYDALLEDKDMARMIHRSPDILRRNFKQRQD